MERSYQEKLVQNLILTPYACKIRKEFFSLSKTNNNELFIIYSAKIERDIRTHTNSEIMNYLKLLKKS
jgi:hypothetical protein